MKRRVLAALAAFIIFGGSGVALAQAAQSGQMQLRWQDNSGNNPAVADQEDGFTIERALGANGTFSVVGSVGQNVTTFTDIIANDPGNTTYCYRVQAFNKTGKSTYSPVACATTPSIQLVPGTPSNVTVTVTVTVGP